MGGTHGFSGSLALEYSKKWGIIDVNLFDRILKLVSCSREEEFLDKEKILIKLFHRIINYPKMTFFKL